MTLHMKMILLSLVLLTVGFEVAYGGKLLKKINKTKGQGGLERINGDKDQWVMRKVRKMIKAFNILEEQLVSASVDIASNTAGVASNTAGVASNSANIVSNDGDIVTLTSAVGTNAADIASASANIVSNDADIASLVTDTATNNASIASNDVELATLTGNVTSNAADIASNTAGVASNSANIVSNDGDIVTLTSAVGTNAADIASASANIVSNDADIASLVQDTSNNTAYLASQSSAIGTLQIDVNTNEAGIATNLANIASNVVDIDSHDSRINDVQNDIGDVQNDIGDVQNDIVSYGSRLLDLETMGSGSVWFDAVRTSSVSASGSWTTITYTNVRESSAGAMDKGTGVFTAALAGTYQFMVQAYKGNDYCQVRILLDGTGSANTMSYIRDDDSSNAATITGTAIIEMQPGQKVWADTYYKLSSSSNSNIHFTGVLITPN